MSHLSDYLSVNCSNQRNTYNMTWMANGKRWRKKHGENCDDVRSSDNAQEIQTSMRKLMVSPGQTPSQISKTNSNKFIYVHNMHVHEGGGKVANHLIWKDRQRSLHVPIPMFPASKLMKLAFPHVPLIWFWGRQLCCLKQKGQNFIKWLPASKKEENGIWANS